MFYSLLIVIILNISFLKNRVCTPGSKKTICWFVFSGLSIISLTSSSLWNLSPLSNLKEKIKGCFALTSESLSSLSFSIELENLSYGLYSVISSHPSRKLIFFFDLCFGMHFVFLILLLSDLFGLNYCNRLKMPKDWGFLLRIVVFLNVCGFWIRLFMRFSISRFVWFLVDFGFSRLVFNGNFAVYSRWFRSCPDFVGVLDFEIVGFVGGWSWISIGVAFHLNYAWISFNSWSFTLELELFMIEFMYFADSNVNCSTLSISMWCYGFHCHGSRQI